ncbi:HTH-type transcriptional activator RhaS [Lachnospiraceae bacterium]|jgi:AraC-like DNA-binding protein|nr:AraC family transcriptional regulator [Lachnospiraceae bacterium]MCX4272203.1 AraC family transcriptional regulator [Acetatifactor sp.]GFH96836.1 HTH-type transcriptional activator RhaS [Lachnospiraceae bacterium]
MSKYCATEDNAIRIEEMNPTFLFTWKGTRTEPEEAYHCHDIAELAFVMSGTGKYRIEGQVYEVGEGDLLFFKPGVHHQALYVPEAEVPATEFFVGFCDVQLPGRESGDVPLPGGGYILHTSGELRQRIFRICSSMEAESAVCWQGRYHMLKAYLMQLLLLILKEQSPPPQAMQGYSFDSVNKKYVVEQIVSYFEDHYSDKISLDTIAENMYLSPFYISKIFKSETGDTPIRHLINIRLERARELLLQGSEMSVQEVAAAVGYDDAYHFSKLFKKYYGKSPSQIRKEGV